MSIANPPETSVIEGIARRVFGAGRALAVERVREGVSTFVYRVVRGEERFYLRALPEVGKTFAPETRAHALLRERGVRVPAIVHYTPLDDTCGLSIMVTTEIPGEAVARVGWRTSTPAVLAEAGRGLARLNALPVDGFGWVARDHDHVATIAAEDSSNRAFLTARLDQHLAQLGGAGVLAPSEIAPVRAALARHDAWLDAPLGLLAHGDFDLTHIFEDAGRYSGIIDLGELRGADRWYDLGHFALRDGEQIAASTLPHLLAGYAEVAPLPDDHPQRIAFASLLIGLRIAARSLARRGADGWDRSALRAIRRGIAALA